MFSFFIFEFATGHTIGPTNLIFGMKAHCDIERAHTKILKILKIDDFRHGTILALANGLKCFRRRCTV